MGQRPIPVYYTVSEAELRGRYGRAPSPRRSVLSMVLRAALLFALVAAGGVLVWALHDLPLSAALKPAAQPIIVLEAADGQELGRTDAGRGLPVERSQIPKTLANAVIAIEDRRFYEHNGIDFRGILRAFARNMQAGGVKEGGSTITQQLARTLMGEDDRTIRRKIRETVLALYMEAHLSKDQILTRYLNNIYLGAGATGISAAAQVYFRKKVQQLTLAESAMLAGLIQAPSHLNPLRNPRVARERARLVLDAMVSNGSLTRRQASATKKRPAQVKRGKLPQPARSWFADWLHGEALKLARREDFQGVLRVRTTLSPALQNLAERVVAKSMKQDGANRRAQVALVAMKPDGAVVAMVGGRNYNRSPFNRAVQAKRQPGSTFKLFVYYAALRNGYSPEDVVDDAPLKIGRWEPQNLDRRHYGRVTLTEAFARSLNLATVRLAQDVGIDEVIEAARRLGIDAPLATTPSLALGTSEVSLIDLTGAYASILAGEAPVEPWGIITAKGTNGVTLHPSGSPNGPKVKLDADREMLIELLMQSVAQGTGQAAMWHGPAAGKTGTTANNRDAWFVGFTDQLVVGVWVGNDDNKPLKNIAGGDLPARIWRDFVANAQPFMEDAPREEWVAGSDGPSPWSQAERPRRSFAEIIGGLFSRARRQTQALGAECDYEACARTYRSFRPSDCSYQPYSGRRKLCVIEGDEADPWGIVTEGSFWEEDIESDYYAFEEAEEY